MEIRPTFGFEVFLVVQFLQCYENLREVIHFRAIQYADLSLKEPC